MEQCHVDAGIACKDAVVQAVSAFAGAMLGIYLQRNLIKQLHDNYFKRGSWTKPFFVEQTRSYYLDALFL